MATLLPIPVQDYVPKMLLGNVTTSGQALIDYYDEKYLALEKEIFEIFWFRLLERCPANFLDEWGALLSADLKQTDSDYTKRKKIQTAIETHKVRGSWVNDAKNRIDAITGLDAEIYSSPGQDDWIMVGEDTEPVGYYTAILGADGIDLGFGISLAGEGDELVISGNIYIDCHHGVNVATLTADQIAEIIYQIQDDVAPAYMRIVLGYINVGLQFIEYGRIE